MANFCPFLLDRRSNRFLISGLNLINEQGEKVGRVKNIQADKKSVQEAKQGLEVAISVSGTNFERQLKDKQFLFSDLGESQFKTFKKNKDLLTQEEIKVLQEIATIKRQKKDGWGL